MPRPSVEVERRRDIMIAACGVIADVGLQSFRVADVAARANVSSGTVHYYFSSKREVIVSAFEYNFEQSLESRRRILSNSDNPLQTLEDLCVSYLPISQDATRAWKVWAELWSEGVRDPALQEINTRLYGQWRTVIVDLIREAQKSGAVCDSDSESIADSIVALIDGVSIQYLMNFPHMTEQTMRDQVTRQIELVRIAD